MHEQRDEHEHADDDADDFAGDQFSGGLVLAIIVAAAACQRRGAANGATYKTRRWDICVAGMVRARSMAIPTAARREVYTPGRAEQPESAPRTALRSAGSITGSASAPSPGRRAWRASTAAQTAHRDPLPLPARKVP